MSDTPRDPTDERDERIATLLETEPLDEVTRARLVRNAMAAAPRAHSKTRWLAVAAALVLVLAVGLAVVVRDDSSSKPTAARSAPAPEDKAAGSPMALAPERGSSAFAITPSDLGDLGNVSSAAMLRRAVNAAEAAAPASAPASADVAARSAGSAPQAVTTSCTAALPGAVAAVGTGTSHGKPVTVYVVERKDGSRAAVVVGADCDVGKPVPL
jgi:hypothetical protein